MNDNFNNENFFKILKSFHEKCKKENIWYSLCGKTLLISRREKNKNEDFKNIEVMMTPESYKLFIEKYSSNILDSQNNSGYFFTCPIYFEENNDIVIKICLLIPALIKKCQKIYSIKNLLRQRIGYYKTIKSINGVFKKIFKFFYWLLNLIWSPLTWQEISSNIYDENYEGFFVINSLKPNINVNWIHSLSKNTITIIWNKIEVEIIEEFKIYLIKNYGDNWKQYSIPDNDYNYFLLTEIIKQ